MTRIERNLASSPTVMLSRALIILLGTAVFTTCADKPARGSVRNEIRLRVDTMPVATPQRQGRTDPHKDVVRILYERRSYRPLWTRRAARDDLIATIREVENDGLTPEHYHLAELDSLSNATLDAAGEARLDLLATDALALVSHDLRFGRADPVAQLDSAKPVFAFGGSDPVADLQRVAGSRKLREEILALRPDHYVYRGLLSALSTLRQIDDAGGWSSIPDGPAIKPGAVDERVPLLRDRLAASGDFSSQAPSTDSVYDPPLDSAVRRFQKRHGLNSDGIVGSSVIETLNVPVAQRIDEVRVNLERSRWILHGIPDTSVMVNVAAAMIQLIEGDSIAFETRAIVGEEYTRTPVFSAPMSTIDLNPTWTVPPGIVGEMIDKVKREPGYLQRDNIKLLDKSGRAVDASQVDFASYTPEDFPYTIRQEPGPTNALGKIKFLFPNEYNVYLHDTPSRSLFAREERLFSHGCIRVQYPLKLAEHILGDSTKWNERTLQAAINTGKTQTIKLERKLPVLVLYWTAFTDPAGELQFYRDVYDRDAALLAELNRS